MLTDERTLTYRELADETASVAAELGAERRLVLIETRNELSTLVAYLGALAAHHVVMPLPAGGNHETVIRTYAPDVIVRNGSIAHRPGPGRRMHPALALLLSTSGSTGSPKLVRLSTANLERERRIHRSVSGHQANRPGRNDIADVILLRTVRDSQPSTPRCRTDPDGPFRRRRPVLGVVRPPARNHVRRGTTHVRTTRPHRIRRIDRAGPALRHPSRWPAGARASPPFRRHGQTARLGPLRHVRGHRGNGQNGLSSTRTRTGPSELHRHSDTRRCVRHRVNRRSRRTRWGAGVPRAQRHDGLRHRLGRPLPSDVPSTRCAPATSLSDTPPASTKYSRAATGSSSCTACASTSSTSRKHCASAA